MISYMITHFTANDKIIFLAFTAFTAIIITAIKAYSESQILIDQNHMDPVLVS